MTDIYCEYYREDKETKVHQALMESRATLDKKGLKELEDYTGGKYVGDIIMKHVVFVWSM